MVLYIIYYIRLEIYVHAETVSDIKILKSIFNAVFHQHHMLRKAELVLITENQYTGLVWETFFAVIMLYELHGKFTRIFYITGSFAAIGY
jgi:hypothetical protein